jgi:maltose alpha-D-glucosyltransferase/alpha-amylase
MSAERLWYKDAIFYELRVGTFYDSNGDGIGDLRGLTQRLDYLQDLGVTTLWLLPFYPSPKRDDGYDIAHYTKVHSEIGSSGDFRQLLREAHERGLRVVTELVLNHTSDQHPWFQRARRARKGSRQRNWYVWTDDPDKYPAARIIFTDYETSNWTWDPLAKQYYWHRFFSHQPDLNFDNPEVRKAMIQVVDFWFELGVDGLRLDAVPYLYERDGTSCENLPETHAFLAELRRHVDDKFRNRMLLAEANQWPEDAVAYFGKGDECHMAFHFPIMPRLYMALRMEDHYPILDILEQTPEIPEDCQWAIFLRNHDELTLEMVSDEERDYMVRAYAGDPQARINLGIRRRLAPLLNNNRKRIELMNALLFSLPGTPVLYYGDEIGMGDNVYLGDRNGVRTPMQWSPDRNAGFSRANPQQLFLPPIVDPEYHYEAVNVETQQSNPSSLLWWTKRLMGLRKQHLAFGRGSLQPVASQRRILAFLRRHGEEVVLVVANLSRFSQYAELDLSEFRGQVPVELFGRVPFPPITERLYLLTLGPHSFYWLLLERPREEAAIERGQEVGSPQLEVEDSWEELLRLRPRGGSPLDRILADYVSGRRWFRSKARQVKTARCVDWVALGPSAGGACLALVEMAYAEGDPETYVLPLSWIAGETVSGALALVRLRKGDQTGSVVDAFDHPGVAETLLDLAIRQKRLGRRGFELRGFSSKLLRDLRDKPIPLARSLGCEQSNTSIVYGGQFIAKLLRRVEEGESVELEALRQISARAESTTVKVPALVGHVELHRGRRSHATLMVVQTFVPNRGDAWTFTVDEVQRYFQRVLTYSQQALGPPQTPGSTLDLVGHKPPGVIAELVGGYLEIARLLGRRTGEMHIALASGARGEAFGREKWSTLAQRSFYQSVRSLASRSLSMLRAQRDKLGSEAGEAARRVLLSEKEIISRLKTIIDRPLEELRIRGHGDYHLGQVLYTGDDFWIIDFEGEPARSLAERRRRRSPLADIAGMLRSFHYAVSAQLMGAMPGTEMRPQDVPVLEPWADAWYAWVSAAFVESYLWTIRAERLLPEDRSAVALVLDLHLLEKALYEVSYELNNRPDWVGIPLRGVLHVLGKEGHGG